MSSDSSVIIDLWAGEAEDILDDGEDRPDIEVLHIRCMSSLNLLVECTIVG